MQTLASVVSSQGALPERDAAAWTLRLAKRVEALHRLGVSHGGLSAEAVRVSGVAPSSRAVLADVREVPPQSGYRSPERAGLDGVSAADDAWAIGATLFFLLTGTVPPGGEALRSRGANLPPLAVFGIDDEGLQRLVDRFLAPMPSERVAKVATIREMLEGWLVDPTDRMLPALEESGGVGERPVYDDDDDDEDNAATQMRDVGDIQALMAQMAMAGAAPPPQPAVAPAPPGPPAAPEPAARPRPDPRRGTLLGFAQVALPSAPPALDPNPRATAPAPTSSLPQPSAAPRAPEPSREIQPTMRSLGVPPIPSSAAPPRGPAVAPPPAPVLRAAVDDDDDEGGGATLMLDAGPLDLSAAIEDALQRGSAPAPVPVPAPAHTVPMPGGGATGPAEVPPSAVDQFLSNPWNAGPQAGPRPPQVAASHTPNLASPPFAAPSFGYPPAPAAMPPQGFPPAPMPPAPMPPASPALNTEGRALKIALAVGIVLLVIVAAAVVTLYLKRQG